MPTTKSAKKRVRQNEKQRDANRAARSKIRTSVKKAAAAGNGKDESADKSYRKAASELDKAARKGLIKKNEANRRKARLARSRSRAGE
jgi:small subunit ribosomal protein S20